MVVVEARKREDDSKNRARFDGDDSGWVVVVEARKREDDSKNRARFDDAVHQVVQVQPGRRAVPYKCYAHLHA